VEERREEGGPSASLRARIKPPLQGNFAGPRMGTLLFYSNVTQCGQLMGPLFLRLHVDGRVLHSLGLFLPE
jgi:hypothetical protein